MGTGNITFAGGTLQYPAGSGLYSTDLSSRFNAVPGGVQAQIDTNGHDASYATAISGDGGLSKLGVGGLTLTAAPTYNGPTAVYNGTLTTPGLGANPVITLGSATTGARSTTPAAISRSPAPRSTPAVAALITRAAAP